MYKCILVPLDNSEIDAVIIDHVQELAKLTNAKVILLHVSDGFVARHQNLLNLAESEEMRDDREYLDKVSASLHQKGIPVEIKLENGEPVEKILQVSEQTNCDLIAMATHGHRWVGDLILGSVASSVRHRTNVPVLLIRGRK